MARIAWRGAFVTTGLLASRSAIAQAPLNEQAGVRAMPSGISLTAIQQRDSLNPPISPRRAFLYSLMLPGLGQSKLQRPSAGALYFGFELTSWVMLAKSAYDLRVAKRGVRQTIVDSYRVDGEGRPIFDAAGKPVIQDTLENRYAVDRDDQRRSRLKARRLHYEDWVALIAFNHLFSAADALVSAYLWDVPRQVEMQTLPGGRTAISYRLSIR